MISEQPGTPEITHPAPPEIIGETVPETLVAEQPVLSAASREQPVLVTGAAGFVGGHVCRELCTQGWRVRALVRNPARTTPRLLGLPLDVVVGDVRDRETLTAALRDAAAVVHLAAIAVEQPGESYDEVNAGATALLVDAAAEAGVTRVVYMSQNGASSASPNRFLRSKGIAEDHVRSSDRTWTVFRPSVIFGAYDTLASTLARLVRLCPRVVALPGAGTARFQPVSADDVARAVGIALDKPETVGGVYPIGGPATLTLEQMAERVLLAMEEERTLLNVPVAMLRPVVALTERVLPRPPVTTELLELLDADNIVEGTALTDVFGIVPTPFAPEELRYLKAVTRRDALQSLFCR